MPICFSIYAASSGVARGITPGSLKLVRNNADITNMKSNPPITGIAGVMWSAKYGQLKMMKVYSLVTLSSIIWIKKFTTLEMFVKTIKNIK